MSELFEIELFICIKIDLALNNLQRWICYKKATNKQTTNIQAVIIIIVSYSKVLQPESKNVEIFNFISSLRMLE